MVVISKDYKKDYYFFAPTLFSTIAFSLFASGVYWCDFIAVNTEIDETGNNGWGLWSYERRGSCYYYSDFAPDSHIIYARCFTVMSQIIGGICLLLLYYSAYKQLSASTWLGIGFAHSFFCSIFSALSLQIFQSDICTSLNYDAYLGMNLGCGYDRGSRCAIAASVLYLFTGMFILLNPPTVEYDDDGNVVTESKESKLQPDGSSRAIMNSAAEHVV